MGKKPEGIADLRAVAHLFPKTDEDQARAHQAKRTRRQA